MLRPAYNMVPSPHLKVKGQKIGEAKVTGNKPQNEDANQAHGLPHQCSWPPVPLTLLLLPWLLFLPSINAMTYVVGSVRVPTLLV